MHTWNIIIRRRRPGFPLQEDSRATGHSRASACRPLFEGDATIRWIDLLDGARLVRVTRGEALSVPTVANVQIESCINASAVHQYDLVTPSAARRFTLHSDCSDPSVQRQVSLAEVEVLCRDAGRADRFEWIKDMLIGQKGALGRATFCERIA